jgi:hypothetical protein|tara:strand:- start:55 stop:294 length:240 start_codon:yes stop_codon:yes gene_type:complete
MSKKKKTKSSKLKDLYLDRPTSHGGWPHGHPGSYRDNKTPVHKQIAQYLEDMGLLESPDHAVLSEQKLRLLIRRFILSS